MLDPVEIAARRMNAGENVGDGWLYGRNALALLASGLVSAQTMRTYRSALFFSAKNAYGADVAKRMEADWLDRHAQAERLQRGLAA